MSNFMALDCILGGFIVAVFLGLVSPCIVAELAWKSMKKKANRISTEEVNRLVHQYLFGR